MRVRHASSSLRERGKNRANDGSPPKRPLNGPPAWISGGSNVTWLVDRLEEHGLAERRAHPTDRRIRTVALTKKGARVRAQVEAKLFEAPDYMHELSPRDLETLCRILDKIAPEGGPHF